MVRLVFECRVVRILTTCCLLFVNARLFGQSGSLSLSSGSALLGASTSLNLSFTSGGTLPAGVQWTLFYNPSDVASVNITAGPVLLNAGKNLTCRAVNGSLICLASGVNENGIASGVMAIVTVTLAAATSGSSVAVSMGSTSGVLPNGTGAAVSGSGGVISVTNWQNPLPAITSLSPSSATAGSPSFVLTVNGTGCVSGSRVLWNGGSRATTYVSATQLQAAITAADIGNPFTAQVAVSSPPPGGGVSSSAPFVVNGPGNPVPAITSLSPSSAAAGSSSFALTVNGTGFVSGSLVLWNGGSRATTYVSATQLQATITAADIGNPFTAQVAVSSPPP